MLTFKDNTVPTKVMMPQVAEVSAANKKQRKKRGKKKTSNQITSPSDSSDSESELNVEVATIKPMDVHLLGAVISNPTENSIMILAQTIGTRMSIDHEEVMKCIGWMWDQGLKYDDEESVEKCLKQQPYNEVATVPITANSSKLTENSPPVDSNHVETYESVDFPDTTNTIDRLNVVAAYAGVNLYDTLVAICSWATLFDERKEGVAKSSVFFASDCLDKVMEALIADPQVWESKLEIPTALESLLTHFILDKMVLQKVLDSIVYLLRMLLQRSAASGGLSDAQRVKVGKQFAVAIRIILRDCSESPGQEFEGQLQQLEKEILQLKGSSDPKAMFQLRELYLDLATLSNQQAADVLRSKGTTNPSNAKQLLLQQINNANVLVQHDLEGRQAEMSKLQSNIFDQTKKDNEKWKKVILKERDEVLHRIQEVHNHKAQLFRQLQQCEQEILTSNERLADVNSKLSEIDRLLNQKKDIPHVDNKLTGNLQSFHLDESEKIVDQAQRYLVDHMLRNASSGKDPSERVLDKVHEAQSIYLDNEIRCIMFVARRLQHAKTKVRQWTKDIEVYTNLHLQKLLHEIDRQIAQTMIEIREDQSTVEQLLEYLDSTCKSWNISGTEFSVVGFLELIAVAQTEELKIPLSYFADSPPAFQQSVILKIQEMLTKQKDLVTTVKESVPLGTMPSVANDKVTKPQKTNTHQQQGRNISRKKGVEKNNKVAPVEHADTLKTIAALEKSSANKTSIPQKTQSLVAPNSSPSISNEEKTPHLKSFLDIQREQAGDNLVS